ncbi:glycosyl hydrolase [Paenibacillus sp. QZ-Y1]|uniref:glycosyl hydrolase n=1 Tax=Paenibacillus sp. QZ-Y1 TaxID=3414511 RepID=UPI003F7978E3
MTDRQISSILVNEAATFEARELMKYLVESYGKAVLSGQQDYSNLNWINENTLQSGYTACYMIGWLTSSSWTI